MDGRTEEALAGKILAAATAWGDLLDCLRAADPRYCERALEAAPWTVDEIESGRYDLEAWAEFVITDLRRFRLRRQQTA